MARYQKKISKPRVTKQKNNKIIKDRSNLCPNCGKLKEKKKRMITKVLCQKPNPVTGSEEFKNLVKCVKITPKVSKIAYRPLCPRRVAAKQEHQIEQKVPREPDNLEPLASGSTLMELYMYLKQRLAMMFHK